METKKPKVTLIAHTHAPIETISAIWKASREEGTDIIPATHIECQKRRGISIPERKEMEELFVKVLESGIPVGENVSFTFLLENISIAFREQMVRHRVGVKVGERMGVDIIPDLADSTWWSQSTRVLNMGEFANNGAFEIPESIRNADDFGQVLRIYRQGIFESQDTYKALMNAGIPAEDARNVLPLATQHRVTWTLNLCSLKHIIGKRSCWILQAGIWGPILQGMVDELCEQIHPAFRALMNPPCIKNDRFESCHFNLDNELRMLGDDPLPPCSLWANNAIDPGESSCNPNTWQFADVRQINKAFANPADRPRRMLLHTDKERVRQYEAMRKQFAKLWRRDVDSGVSFSENKTADIDLLGR